MHNKCELSHISAPLSLLCIPYTACAVHGKQAAIALHKYKEKSSHEGLR